MSEQACENTDRELWRKGDGDGNGMSYYEPSISVTQHGIIQINVGGAVFGLPVEEWHRLAVNHFTSESARRVRVRELLREALELDGNDEFSHQLSGDIEAFLNPTARRALLASEKETDV